jgi:membrane-associated phospholipid phosphatase
MYRAILKENSQLIKVFTILHVLLLIPIVLWSKEEIHLFINQFHGDFADFFFKNLTFVGDGMFTVYIAIIFLFIRFRHSVFLLMSLLSSGLLAQIFKRLFFPGAMRPAKFFENSDLYIHYVEGVNLHHFKSFPSGHTTSAFALMISLAILTNNKGLKILFLLIAYLAGFSRMYLSQHFMVDVYVGAIFGLVFAFLMAFLVQKYIADKKWSDMSILSFFKS